jgi:hypothetical protein
MGQSIETTQRMKVRLSTMWIFAVLNYIYCDVFTAFATLSDPAAMKDIVSGHGGTLFTPGKILGFSVFDGDPDADGSARPLPSL